MLDYMMKNTVAKVVEEGLCASCGICAGACYKQSISFCYGKERNVPVVDATTCVNCGICFEVCPGKGVALNRLSKFFFSGEEGVNKDTIAGYYRHVYAGHSTDENIRYHSATGGMVTQFLIWLWQKKEIEGAVVVRYRKDNPFEPEPFIATTPGEIWESRSSKYVVLSHDNVAKEVADGQYKNLVVVGLPCQIQGWRQLAEKNKRVREAVKGYFSIYCSINKTKLSMEYYLKRYHIDPTQVGRFVFRDDGCMGYMKFENKQGEVMKKIPYKSFWLGTHSFFINPRCLSCIDQLGDLADISFGDIHIEPYSEDAIGTNSILTRSNYWDCLLRKCKEDGAISMDEIPMETLLRSQTYVQNHKKGAGAKAYMNLCKMFGKSIPLYDYEYKEHVYIKHYMSALSKMLMYFVGKNTSLWWIVGLLDRTKS